ncbi:hypothetical protein ACJX0J_039069, partial [Zea mays]
MGSASAASPKPKFVSSGNDANTDALLHHVLRLVHLHPVHQLLQVLVVVVGPHDGEAAAREGQQLHRERDVLRVRHHDLLQGLLGKTVIQAAQGDADLSHHELRALVVAVELGDAGAWVDDNATGERVEVVKQGR